MTNRIKEFLILAVLFFSFNAYALNCDSQSPDYIKLGEKKYFDTKTGDSLTSSQQGKIKKLFKKINRRINGRATENYCFSPDNTVKVVKHKISNGKINLTPDGQLEFIFDIDNLKTGVNTGSSLKFFDKLSVDELIDLTTYNLTIKTKHRKKGSVNSSYIYDRLLSFSILNNRLEINSVTYINGYYSDSWRYNLRE